MSIDQEFSVHPVTIGQWKKEIQEQTKTLFEGKRVQKAIDAHREPELLFNEIGKLAQIHRNASLPFADPFGMRFKQRKNLLIVGIMLSPENG